MPDRGMVVKWFEFCRVEDKCSTDCPYFDNNGSARECTKKLAKDVLTLLKEQKKAKVVFGRCKDGSFATECGHCGMYLDKAYSICPKCNKELDWNSNQN